MIGAPFGLAQGSVPPDAGALMAGVERAIVSGDWVGAERSLDLLWEADRERAREAGWQLVTSEAVAHRPLGLEAFRRHGTADELASAARALDAQRFADERRWLVRAIGAGAGDDAVSRARAFLSDRDPYVRAGAAWALADLGDVSSVAEYARRLRSVPAGVQSWPDDDDAAEQMALYGAVRTLTGLRPRTSREVLDWVREHREVLGGLRPPEPLSPEEWPREEDALQTPSLRVEFDLREAAPPAEGPGGEGEFLVGLERSVEAARAAAEPIFGRVHLPVIRLVFADDQTIGKFGGTSRGYYGFARGNKIAMRLTEWQAVRTVLVHEYVHIIHDAVSERQPRWLSEGLAESLTRSARSSAWASALAPGRATHFAEMASGGLSGVVRWESSGSSGEDPGLYARAHIAVDYLRFGGFGAEGARLALLVSRISRGERPAAALEQVYGGTLAELDEGLAAWVGRLSAAPPP